MNERWKSVCICAALFFITVTGLAPAPGWAGTCPHCKQETCDDAGMDCPACDVVKSKLHKRTDKEAMEAKSVDFFSKTHCPESNKQTLPASLQQPHDLHAAATVFTEPETINTADISAEGSDPMQAYEESYDSDNFVTTLETMLLFLSIQTRDSDDACLPDTDAIHELKSLKTVKPDSPGLVAASLTILDVQLQDLKKEVRRGRIIIRIKFRDQTITLLHIDAADTDTDDIILSSDEGWTTTPMNWEMLAEIFKPLLLSREVHEVTFIVNSEEFPSPPEETTEDFVLTPNTAQAAASVFSVDQIAAHLIECMDAWHTITPAALALETIQLAGALTQPTDESVLNSMMQSYGYLPVELQELSQNNFDRNPLFILLSSSRQSKVIHIKTPIKGICQVWLGQDCLGMKSHNIIPFLAWLKSLAGQTVRLFSFTRPLLMWSD